MLVVSCNYTVIIRHYRLSLYRSHAKSRASSKSRDPRSAATRIAKGYHTSLHLHFKWGEI